MPTSLSFLLSSDAAEQRMIERKPAFVVHLEVAPGTDSPMTEIDAIDLDHAQLISCDWLCKGRAVSAGIRQVNDLGFLGDPTILDLTDFKDELAKQTQSNLNRVMSGFGLVG